MAFMQGRNGMDELYFAMLGVYMLLIFVNLFVRSRILSIVIWIWLALAFARFFSKNLVQRQKENAVLLRLIDRFRRKKNARDPYEIKMPTRRQREREKRKAMKWDKTHVFRNCPHCGATIRLPKVKGTHALDCPKCGTEFQVKIR